MSSVFVSFVSQRQKPFDLSFMLAKLGNKNELYKKNRQENHQYIMKLSPNVRYMIAFSCNHTSEKNFNVLFLVKASFLFLTYLV